MSDTVTAKTPPPPAIGSARVLRYALLDSTIEYSGRTLLFVGGKELGQVPCLAICQNKSTPEIVLFHCAKDWNFLGCSAHQSVDAAKTHAEGIYHGVGRLWVDANISVRETEHYLDELWGETRCSFCGRRPDQGVEKLVGKDSVRICDRCVNEFYAEMHRDDDGDLNA